MSAQYTIIKTLIARKAEQKKNKRNLTITNL